MGKNKDCVYTKGIFIIAWSLAVSVSAQPSLDEEAARQLIREQQRNEVQLQRQQEQTQQDIRLEGVPTQSAHDTIPDNETPCFPIHTITLTGEHAEPFQWLLHHVGPVGQSKASPIAEANPNDTVNAFLQNRCLGVTGINIIMARMQNALVEAGYITSRVVIANQDLREGTLGLTLVPGRIRDIQLSKQSFYRDILPLDTGRLLNLRDIEQSLESLKRLPSVEADIQIIPAQSAHAKPGESDLDIQWEQGRPWRVVTTLDNAGSESTGVYQGGITYAHDNLFGLHDILNLSYNHDVGGAEPLKGGTEAFGFNYSVPMGYWTAALNINANTYLQTVQGAFEQIQYSGDSRSVSVDLSRLIERNSTRKITAGMNIWFRNSKNFVDDLEQVIQRRRTAGVEWSLDLRQFIGKATLDGSLGYRKGTGMFDSLRAPEESLGEGTSRPTIIKSNLQLSVPFSLGTQRLNYTGSWRRQHNRDPLTAQDRFSIGGRYTVRGFDGESTLAAERGWLVRNDVSWYLGTSSHALYLGVDYGRVNGFSEQFLIGDHLAGGALGIKGTLWGANYDLSFGVPINQPDGFVTDSVATYFSMNWAF